MATITPSVETAGSGAGPEVGDGVAAGVALAAAGRAGSVAAGEAAATAALGRVGGRVGAGSCAGAGPGVGDAGLEMASASLGVFVGPGAGACAGPGGAACPVSSPAQAIASPATEIAATSKGRSARACCEPCKRAITFNIVATKGVTPAAIQEDVGQLVRRRRQEGSSCVRVRLPPDVQETLWLTPAASSPAARCAPGLA